MKKELRQEFGRPPTIKCDVLGGLSMTNLLRREIHGCDWLRVLGEADLVRRGLGSEAVQAVMPPRKEALN